MLFDSALNCNVCSINNYYEVLGINSAMYSLTLYSKTVIISNTLCNNKNSIFREELIAYFHLLRHGPHRKRHVLRFYCMYISCRGNVFTELCLATIGGYTHRHRLMGGIYGVHRWDGPRCHDTHIVTYSGFAWLLLTGSWLADWIYCRLYNYNPI
jgi:hypothetical protein